MTDSTYGRWTPAKFCNGYGKTLRGKYGVMFQSKPNEPIHHARTDSGGYVASNNLEYAQAHADKLNRAGVRPT